MKDPIKEVKVINPGATYEVPTYKVKNDGLKDAGAALIKLCKGNKEDEKVFRQTGMFTESLIQVNISFLKDVNQGGLENSHTTKAIEHLEKALKALQDRSKDRQSRNVQRSHKP